MKRAFALHLASYFEKREMKSMHCKVWIVNAGISHCHPAFLPMSNVFNLKVFIQLHPHKTCPLFTFEEAILRN